MAEAHAKDHDYHIIDPSPWPFLGSVGAFVMALGAVAWMQYIKGNEFHLFGLNIATPWLFFIGLAIVLYTMAGWWSDTIKEAHQGHHTRVVSLHLRYGMIMFIASEVMFFVAWFWAFFDASLFAGEAIQAYEYNHILHENLFFNEEALNSGLYGSIFFMATGFHGFHVLLGTIFLAVCLLRLMAGQFTPQKHFGFEAAAWYWHFVDVVWLFLYANIYVWASVGATIAEGH